MRLFVRCGTCGAKLPFQGAASTRAELPWSITGTCAAPACGARTAPQFFTAQHVEAELGVAPLLQGGALGAVAGALIAGPLGLGLGALAGGALGRGAQQDEAEAVRRFNSS